MEAPPTTEDIRRTAVNIHNTDRPDWLRVESWEDMPERDKPSYYERACEVYRRIELL